MSAMTDAEWTKYWDVGLTTTFGGNIANYDGEVAAFWARELDGQAGHVVDLCCGNGALVWLANELLQSAAPAVRISGVDSADIRPFELLKKAAADYPAIEFIGGTSIESLPFQDASIDMAISQYGIEYADFDRTFTELDRVLKPTAKIALIVHSDASVVVRESTASAEMYEYLLGEGKFYETALELDTFYNTKKHMAGVRSDPQAARLLGRLNRASFEAHNLHFASPTDYTSSQQTVKSYIAFIMRLYDGSMAVRSPERRGVLEQWHAVVTSTLRRIADLQSAALSEQRLEHLRECIGRSGFTLVRDEPFYYGPAVQLYGTALVACRGG